MIDTHNPDAILAAFAATAAVLVPDFPEFQMPEFYGSAIAAKSFAAIGDYYYRQSEAKGGMAFVIGCVAMKNLRSATNRIGELSSGKCYVYPVHGEYTEGTFPELVGSLIRDGNV